MLICVDWGTTNARAWLVGDAGEVRLRALSKVGMSGLQPDQFAPALDALIGAWVSEHPETPALLSGMVGAKGGWREAPYVGCPFDAKVLAAGLVRVAPHVWIVPGARVLKAVGDAPVRDVMRGEEVQILGALAAHPGLAQVCLPGTHSKWVDVVAGRARTFTTYMTGELFSLMADRSLLARSVGAPEPRPFGTAFEDGVKVGARLPLAGALFGVRTRDVAAGLPAHQNRAYLSGLLVGHELAGALGDGDGAIGLCGAIGLAPLYERALTVMGRTATVIDVEAATLAGLRGVAKAAGLIEEMA